MLCFVMPIILILGLILLCIIGTWAIDRDRFFIFIPAIALAVVMFLGIIGSAITAFDYVDYLMNTDVRIDATVEKRDSLIQLLSNYNLIMENDITASDAYITIHKDVLNFNNKVRRANHWQDAWWAEGWVYDPTYVGLSTIPIN